MNTYPEMSFDDLSAILASRANALGCTAFSLKDEPIETEIALDAAGPLTWALMLHAKSLAHLSGLCSPNETNGLPLTIALKEDAPLGNEVVINPGRVSMATTLALLDASLEHAVCLGIKHFGYTPEEWDELPYENRVIPLETYISDLQANWITDELESGDPQTQINNWPTLIDRASLSQAPDADMSNEQGLNRSRILKFPSL